MSEYGTGRGGIARRRDGSSKELKTNERAMVERIKAKRDVPSFTEPRIESVVEVTPDGPVEVVRPFKPDVDAIAEVDAKTNRYGRETRSDPVATD
jgi:hypothetical protein